ncbi:hypothetical protein ACFL3B_03930 [Gemmatimonadota bacterium]
MTNRQNGEKNGGVKLPIVSIILMIVFSLGGSLMILVDWPAGPANLDWGVLILCYGGYAYLIGASIFYVKTGK